MNKLYIQQIEHFLPTVFSALIILFLGILIAYLCRSLIRRLVKIENNKMLKAFSENLVFSLIVIITLISTLSKLGVPTASLIAVVGAAGLAIGLALKNFLSNIAAGFMIVFLKPFKIGDYVKINSDAGTLISINLFMLQLRTSNNESLFIPNSKVITNSIINQSFYETKRSDLVIGVDYSADLKQAKDIINTVLLDNPLILKTPEPLVSVQDLADSSVNLLVRFWAESANMAEVKSSLLESIKEKLTAAEINLPFPQLDVHINNPILSE